MWKLLAAGVVSVCIVALSSQPPNIVKRESDLRPLLLRPGVVSLLARSQRPLLIDLLWLRALNAVGDPESTRKNRALYEYGVFLTEVDPRFFHAYLYMGINVPAYDGGAWVNGELAADLFTRGIKQFPDNFKLHLQRAMNAFLVERDYARASDYFLETSKLPGAPLYLAPLAVKLRARHNVDEGLALAREVFENTDNPDLKADYEQKIRGLEIEPVLKKLDAAITQYEKQTSEKPRYIEELRFRGVYDGPDTDQFGGKLFIDLRGRAMSETVERRVELYNIEPE